VPVRTSRRLLPLTVAAFAFLIYFRTLIPGLGGGGDAAKFQYLGSVLGTAHPPGYPLYIFVSYIFSHLPAGVMAFRMNLMSAFFAALTAAVATLTLDRLKCPPVVSAAAALGLAFGPIFWSKSTVAEVYTLNAALSSLIVWQALRWADSGRRRDLYLTAALLGLSLGNHLTAAMLAPALALFVLAVRPDEVRVKTAVTCIALGALGLTQYGFILIRTWQKSPYAEAQAANLTELWHVIIASKYSGDMFRYSAGTLFTERVPALAGVFVHELGVAGVAALALGMVWGVAARSRAALLFVGALIGVAFLTLNVDADSEGFILPAFVMAWLLAGLGMSWLVTWLRRLGRPAAAAGLLACAALPLAQLSSNYAASDHHRRTYEARYMNALFATLGPRAAFVQEEYAVDQLLLYKLAGEHAAGGRSILLVGRDMDSIQRYAREDYAIYAYRDGREKLEGLGFRFEPVQLIDGSGEPVEMSYLPLFRMRAWAPCREIANTGWQDITTAAGIEPVVLRLDNYRPFDARATFYAVSQGPESPVVAAALAPRPITSSTSSFSTSSPADIALLEKSLDRDDVPAGLRARLRGRGVVHRLEIVANDDGQSSLSALGLGAYGAPVIGRIDVDANDSHRGTVCGWAGRTLFAAGQQDEVSLSGTDDDLFGGGWEPVSRDEDDQPVRWLTSSRAEIIVPLAAPAPMTVRIRAAPSDDDHAHALAISFNGRRFPAKTMANAWTDYTWDLGDDVSRRGANALEIDVAGTQSSPEHAAAIAAVSFVRALPAERADQR
jgi:hypothetical protein